MFVDEGMGSLDYESLNQAMRALQNLTEGNRLVGIISHVTELKECIDKQIAVPKKRGENHVNLHVHIKREFRIGEDVGDLILNNSHNGEFKYESSC